MGRHDERTNTMRTRIGYELIGTAWFMGMALGVTEGVRSLSAVCIIIGTIYYLRAAFNFFIEG